MNNISAQTTTTTMMENQTKLVSHADESWILNDGQNNMYAAIIALGDPSKQKLAETTWGQAVAAYQDSVAQLAKLRGVIRDPSAKVRLRAIDASLASYNAFSQQLRRAALAGDAHQAVYIQTVGNLTPSNALPVEFCTLRNAFERREAQSMADAKSVRSCRASGTSGSV